ncbi:putative nucleoside-diphosphate-sugar epimerase protein [Phaeoacremonium minimum UCRPA7]|uniref:Putative nucleoside-diphosphate-sugar epimerase protein n=1 Tax=Phaeoacremonium minimum (strain UCR-PA7) TaxID=1286976 RepID=R8B948_PHAM7|nr:putative nucleoside-diphosphate-sugar epimerase protein [Phaeoacremonium minimum UCRPA7]EON95839.1 putative nucleoside-diphosphate-sugar epimerase protein [Phaeoacremonium minimum UCRPA7]
MHLILTGATGMIGSSALDAMIGMKEITKISILSRGPVKMAEDAKDPRINVITHKDFAQYDSEVLTQLKGASGDYVKITRDWPAEAAKAFQALTPENEPFNFVYVSGVGATTEPGLFSAFWARIKGEAELALADIRKENPLLRASSVRLGFGSEAKHDAIKPYLPSRPYYEKVLRASEPAIRAVMPNIKTN